MSVAYLELRTDRVVTEFPAHECANFAPEPWYTSDLDLLDVIRQDLVDMSRKCPFQPGGPVRDQLCQDVASLARLILGHVTLCKRSLSRSRAFGTFQNQLREQSVGVAEIRDLLRVDLFLHIVDDGERLLLFASGVQALDDAIVFHHPLLRVDDFERV